MIFASCCLLSASIFASSACCSSLRCFSSDERGGMDTGLRKRIDALNDLFVEAREEIEMATLAVMICRLLGKSS